MNKENLELEFEFLEMLEKCAKSGDKLNESLANQIEDCKRSIEMRKEIMDKINNIIEQEEINGN